MMKFLLNTFQVVEMFVCMFDNIGIEETFSRIVCSLLSSAKTVWKIHIVVARISYNNIACLFALSTAKHKVAIVKTM